MQRCPPQLHPDLFPVDIVTEDPRIPESAGNKHQVTGAQQSKYDIITCQSQRSFVTALGELSYQPISA